MQIDFELFGESAFVFNILGWYGQDPESLLSEAITISEYAKVGNVYNRIVPRPEKVRKANLKLFDRPSYPARFLRLRKIWSRDEL